MVDKVRQGKGLSTSERIRPSIQNISVDIESNGSAADKYLSALSHHKKLSDFHVMNGSSDFVQTNDFAKKSPRMRLLLRMMCIHLFLGFVSIVFYFAVPKYPGHYGSIFLELSNSRALQANSVIYGDTCASIEVNDASNSILNSSLINGVVIWILQPISFWSLHSNAANRGMIFNLFSSLIVALTCGFSLAIMTIDAEYLADCCTQMSTHCEESDLCTSITDTCCYGSSVVKYCKNSGARATCIFFCCLVFLFPFVQFIISCTTTFSCCSDNGSYNSQYQLPVADMTPKYNLTRACTPKTSRWTERSDVFTEE